MNQDETPEGEQLEQPDDAAAVDEVFGDTEPPPPPEASEATCRHCNRPAVICEEHALAAVTQAVTDEDLHRRAAGTRAAERKMRQQSPQSTIRDDAEALALIIRRWWGDDKISVAKAILEILEGDPV